MAAPSAIGLLAGTLASVDGLTPAEETALVAKMLREQVGLDPDVLGQALDLAAVGIVNGAWRNGPVEDWHADQVSLTDGAMLMINSYTTWRVREIARRWRREFGLAASSSATELDVLAVAATDTLARRIYGWLVSRNRRLPIGVTLAAVAGNGFAEYVDHVEEELGLFAAVAEHRGGRYAIWRAAAHGGLACRHWWGTPGWPNLVERFVALLDHPADEYGGPNRAWESQLPAEPPQVADRSQLRQVLRHRPWELELAAAEWVVAAGIRSTW